MKQTESNLYAPSWGLIVVEYDAVADAPVELIELYINHQRKEIAQYSRQEL